MRLRELVFAGIILAMKIATWNVNSLKVRLPHLLRYLEAATAPDILLLQELKCQTDDVPRADIEALGYHVEAVGQKTYNGVAIISKQPISVVLRHLPGDETDEQARYLEADIAGLRVAALYLPNGNPVETEKYPYKLGWMARLAERAATLLAEDRPFLLGGDYNICPTDVDLYDPVGWRDDALVRPESRAAFRRLLNLGLTEAFHALHPHAAHAYSFWDYQAGAWQRDNGLRIDHLLLSPALADRLEACEIDKEPRGWERASDHTPVWCRLREAA